MQRISQNPASRSGNGCELIHARRLSENARTSKLVGLRHCGEPVEAHERILEDSLPSRDGKRPRL